MCYNCWYTWYPRGHAVSYKCPYCGSTRTGLDLTGVFAVGLLILAGFAIAYWYIVIPLAIIGWVLYKNK
jgi:hypothetical protein